MTRSDLSHADTELLSALSAEGLSVSPFKLERWRQRGLLARPIVLRGGARGSQVAPVSEQALMAARVLAGLSGRGVAWQVAGLALFDEGLPLSESALRACAEWALARGVYERVHRYWAEAEQSLSLRHIDVDDDRAAVAEAAVDLIQRDRTLASLVSAVRTNLRRYHPNANRAEMEEALQVSIEYQVRDIALGGGLSRDQQFRAIAGRDLEDGEQFVPLLPSSALACARTLTTAEANLVAEWCGLAYEMGLELLKPVESPLLLIVTWHVTDLRVSTEDQANRPCEPEVLASLRERVAEMRREAEEGIAITQLELEIGI